MCDGNCHGCGSKKPQMSETKKALARRLLAAQDATASAKRAMERVLTQLEQFGADLLTQHEFESVKQTALASLDNLVEYLIPVFDTYTEEELLAQVAFYESPVGESIRSKAEAVQAESFNRSMQYAQQLTADISATLEERYEQRQYERRRGFPVLN